METDKNKEENKEPEFGTPEHTKQFLENKNKEKTILKTSKPDAVQKVLQAKKIASKDETFLSFDHKTGELVVSSERMDASTHNVVDQIYKDGFFSKPNNMDSLGKVFNKVATGKSCYYSELNYFETVDM